MDALGPNRSIQWMAVTDVLEIRLSPKTLLKLPLTNLMTVTTLNAKVVSQTSSYLTKEQHLTPLWASVSLRDTHVCLFVSIVLTSLLPFTSPASKCGWS